MIRVVVAAVVCALVITFLEPLARAQSAPTAGIDCECSSVGYYALPSPLVTMETANGLTSSSPGGTYRVTTQLAPQGSFVTVTKKNSSVPLVDHVEASSWGFSPDDDRFVYYGFSGTVLLAHLHDLSGPVPAPEIIPPVDVTLGGLIGFSPGGSYAVALSVNHVTGNQLELDVVDAATGVSLHENELTGYVPSILPDQLPEGQTELGALRLGFGPDAERSLVYGWIDAGTALANWKLVRLDTSPPLEHDGESGQAFTWGFSPCGDRFGIVTGNDATHQKEARLFSTRDHSQPGFITYPIVDDDFLGVDATDHVDFHGLYETPGVLAPNTANASCAPGPPQAPVAAFSVSTPRLPGGPIQFTDQSTTPQGTIATHTWSFGDGTSSSAASPTHTYSASGTFVVSLTVTNSLGKTGSAQETLTIGATAGGALSGTDCECTKKGSYADPKRLVAVQPVNNLTATSPHGTYVVDPSTGDDGEQMFAVRLAGSSAPLIGPLEGSSWGFSPDDDRFVRYVFETGTPYAYLYNLEGPHPANEILSRLDIHRGGLIAFSPGGRWAVTMVVNAGTGATIDIQVLDAESGALVHEDQLVNYSPNLTDGLPAGQEQLGSLRIGFGPNSGDRSLVYAWIAGNFTGAPVDWKLVNLDASPVIWKEGGLFDAFSWGFSPCGDRFATVQEASGVKEARLFSTLDPQNDVGVVTIPLADDTFVTAEATGHFVHHGLSDVELLSSITAQHSCPTSGGSGGGGGTGGGGAPVSPVADFDVGPGRLTGIPITFTDRSTTSKGVITGRGWAFGDGTYASGPTVDHAYGLPGTYEVKLTVTNSFGRVATKTQQLTVAQNQPPVASFTYAPANPSSRDVITFTSTSTDDDTILYTDWTIGNTYYSGPSVQAKVCAPTTTVQMAVTDSTGQTGFTSVDIPIGGTDRLVVAPGSNLETAADGACPGDTLVLEAGSYPGGVTIEDVNIEGAGQGVSFIDGGPPGGWVLTLRPDYVSQDRVRTVSVSRLTVTGGQAGTDPYNPYASVSGGGVSIAYSHGNALLDDVEIAYNDGAAGLSVYNSSGEYAITGGSRVHHNQGDGAFFNVAYGHLADSSFFENGSGAAFTEGGARIERSDFFDNRGAGLWLADADGSILSSRIYGNATAGQVFGVFVHDSATEVAGCLIAENHGGGLDIEQYVTVSSTTIAANCGTGLKSDDGKLYDSIVFGNGLDIDGQLGANGANLIGTDPLFVGGGDYHLSSASPAIDQGDSGHLVSALDQDGDGDDRVLASGSGSALLDIGWDEWSSTQPASTLPTLGCTPGSGGTGGTGTGGSGAGGTATGGTGVGGNAASGGSGGSTTGAAGEAGADGGGTSAGGTLGRGGTSGASGTSGEAGNDGPVAVAGEPGSGAQSGEGPTASGGTAPEGGAPTEGGAPGHAGNGAGRGGRAGGAGAPPQVAPPPKDSGCGCRTANDAHGSPYALALASLLLGMVARRRRSRRGVETR